MHQFNYHVLRLFTDPSFPVQEPFWGGSSVFVGLPTFWPDDQGLLWTWNLTLDKDNQTGKD